MAHHMFDTEDAKKYGLAAAAILHNFRFWIDRNVANEKHFYDGEYWLFNSVKGLSELFDYLTPKQIRTAIEKLVDAGALKKGCYNKSPYDRTAWYCIPGYGVRLAQAGNCELPDRASRVGYEVQCHTDSKLTDSKTDSKNPLSAYADIPRPENTEFELSAPDQKSDPVESAFEEYRGWIQSYNSSRRGDGPALTVPAKLTASRKTDIRRIIRLCHEHSVSLSDVLDRCENSKFLMGRVKDFRISLEWLAKSDNITKILEGYHDNRARTHAAGSNKVHVADIFDRVFQGD